MGNYLNQNEHCHSIVQWRRKLLEIWDTYGLRLLPKNNFEMPHILAVFPRSGGMYLYLETSQCSFINW
jgi:hypothetical protein